jgi:hypothetical protein
MKIIYNEDGNLVVLIASSSWSGTMDELGKKSVPTGLKYKIVEDSFIPTDRTFRNAWEIDESELTDGVGSEFGVPA